MSVHTKDSIYTVRVHLLFIGGDIPAIAKVCGHASHLHRFVCRTCFIDKFSIEQQNFAPQQQIPRLRDPLHYTLDVAELGQQQTPFTGLRIFYGASFFPGI